MLQVGDRVDRFVVEAFLGEGGISHVYKVRHHQLGTVHALKMMALKSTSLTQRLLREGRIQANLSHPGVVAVTDIIEHDGFTGLLMEHVEGRSLDLVLGRTGAPPLPDAMALFRQVLAGVAAAHEAGVLHRDLKPGNVLLQPQGEGVVAKVTDFGIAKMAIDPGAVQTQQSDLMGTPGYMAPEQADDPTKVDARADVYSLGAILYCLVTGRPPFMPGSVLTLLAAARSGDFRPVAAVAPHVPDRIAWVVERCLAPDPADRFEDCRALADALYGDGGPTFDAEVAGAVPAVLHVPGAMTPAAKTLQAGGAETAVPPPTPTPAGEGPPPPDGMDEDELVLEDPGPSGKYIFLATAGLVLAALGWLLFQTWFQTGSVVPDPERARAAVEASKDDGQAGSEAPAPRAPVPDLPPPSEEGAVDPGLDGSRGEVAPLGTRGSDGIVPAPGGSPTPVVAVADADARAGTPSSPPASAEAVPAPAAAAGGTPSPDPSDAGMQEAAVAAATLAPEDAGPGPEARPPASVDLRGTWTGKLGGRPLTLRIVESGGGTVAAEIDVLVGTSYRTFKMRGAATAGGNRLSLSEDEDGGWRLDGTFEADVIRGTILASGRKRGQAFSVQRP